MVPDLSYRIIERLKLLTCETMWDYLCVRQLLRLWQVYQVLQVIKMISPSIVFPRELRLF